MSQRRAGRMWRAGSAALLLVAVLASSAQGADEGRKVFGFITEAEATPLAIEYNQPSFGVPATPTFELRFMHTATNSDSGPASRALASTIWPGDLAGSAPPALAFEQIVSPILQEFIDASPGPLADGLRTLRDEAGGFLADAPSYPIKAETFYPQRPYTAETHLGGGIGMRSRANDGIADATATGSNAGLPGMFATGDMNSHAFSGIKDGIAFAEAEAVMKDVSLFGGIVTIDAMRNHLIATSDGVRASLTKTMTVSGLVLTYPDGSGGSSRVEIATLDERGVVINDAGRMNWDQARDFFDQNLAPYGITIRFLQDDATQAGAHAARAMSGLEIKMDGRMLAAVRDDLPEPVKGWIASPGTSPLGPLYDQLPPTGAGILDSLVQFDQSMTVVLGNAQVNGAASPPFSIDFDPPPPPVTGGPGLPPVTTFPPPVGAPPVSGPAPVPPTTPTFGGTPVAVAVAGIPGGLVTLAVILALAGAMGLRALADRATRAAIAAGADCSL